MSYNWIYAMSFNHHFMWPEQGGECKRATPPGESLPAPRSPHNHARGSCGIDYPLAAEKPLCERIRAIERV